MDVRFADPDGYCEPRGAEFAERLMIAVRRILAASGVRIWRDVIAALGTAQTLALGSSY